MLLGLRDSKDQPVEGACVPVLGVAHQPKQSLGCCGVEGVRGQVRVFSSKREMISLLLLCCNVELFDNPVEGLHRDVYGDHSR